MATMAQPVTDKYCINCWSGPRCCSTSLMYAFAQRADTKVLDEPLYASYVHLTGVDRPYRDKLLAEHETDPNKVVREMILAPRSKKVLYCKHIGKHKLGLHKQLFQHATHMLLVREPYAVLQSFNRVITPTMQELGYTALLEIFNELRMMGRPPLVILSDDLVRHPGPVLQVVCSSLELPFHEAMLSWPEGPKPYDGLWAPWWYSGTHRSTGFGAQYRDMREPLQPELRPLLGECWPLFELLRQHAIRPVDTSVARPLPPVPEDAPSDPSDVEGAGGEERLSERTGTHVYLPDERNKDVLVGIRNGFHNTFDLVWRPQATVSVLDSAFMLGDGIWEGLRLHQGVLLFVQQHLERLLEGAAALDIKLGLTAEQLQRLIYDTVDANGMATASGVHIRLMVSRGLKPTPYQNPATTLGAPTVVVLPEYKVAAPEPQERGIRLFTCHVRRGAPDVQDPGWCSHSKLNCIAACIQANKAGVDEALMLDPHGFVATCNSVNFFCVRKGEVWAPTAKYQLRGITRANVLDLCRAHNLPHRELDFSLTQVYSADEAFVTGTFARIIPVKEVDGRIIGGGKRGPVTAHLQQLYAELEEAYAAMGRQSLL